jgi:hypothetical protein
VSSTDKPYTYKWFCIYYKGDMITYGTAYICHLLNTFYAMNQAYQDQIVELRKKNYEMSEELKKLKEHTVAVMNNTQNDIGKIKFFRED